VSYNYCDSQLKEHILVEYPISRNQEIMKKKAKTGKIILIIVSYFLALFLIYITYKGDRTNFNNAALDTLTAHYYGEFEGRKIHCGAADHPDLCVENSYPFEQNKIVLWFGNSQLHAINQFTSGQRNAPHYLFQQQIKKGRYVVTYSYPNANLQEYYVLLEYLKTRMAISTLIIPIVFDDFRESGVRPALSSLIKDSNLALSLSETKPGQLIIQQYNQTSNSQDVTGSNKKQKSFGNDKLSIQETSENYLNNWLKDHSELWALRPQVRGDLFLRAYQLRNTVFGITPQSKRRIIKGRYNLNMDALKAILTSCRNSGIKVLVYIVPIRNDVDIPYDHGEYTIFKRELKKTTKLYNVQLENLENLVPNRYWGKTHGTGINQAAEVDFMHFQESGHVLLADSLKNMLDSY
jgi:hypothetical protein